MDYFNNRFMNPMNLGQLSNPCPFIYVSNLEEAKNYPVVPNNTCILFKHDFSEFFIKKVDSMGIPEISMFKTERVPIEIGLCPSNERYMHTKKDKMGHILHFGK